MFQQETFKEPSNNTEQPNHAAATEQEKPGGTQTHNGTVDTFLTPLFDQITRIAGTTFSAPICLITLTEETGQVIRSGFGITMQGAMREDSFCPHTLGMDQPTIVLDASLDARFAMNQSAIGPTPIRFYAGAPIQDRNGSRIGTFSIFDVSGRPVFEDSDRHALTDFARLTSDLIERDRLTSQVTRKEEELRSSALLSSEILENTIDCILLVDQDWKITFLNRKAAERIVRGHNLIGRNHWEVTPELRGSPFEHHLRKAHAERVPVSFSDTIPGTNDYLNVEAYPTPNGLAIFFRDVTAEQLQQTASRLHEELYRLATPTTRDGIWDWNVATGRAYFSAHWHVILGLPAQDYIGDITYANKRLHPKDVARHTERVQALIQSDASEFESEYRFRHGDGSWRWMRFRGNLIRGANNQVIRLTGTISDVSEQKRIDSLTHLHNRTSVLEHLENRLDSDNPTDKVFAVLKIGIRGFKHINDSFGQREGDRILLEVAGRLQETLTAKGIPNGLVREANASSSMLARVRGVVFAILLGEVKHPEDAVTYANMLQLILRQPVECGGQTVTLSTHIGIVMCQGNYSSAGRILEDADVAMHQNDGSEIALPVVFTTDMREQTQRRIELESDLRDAVNRKQLLLHYQPKVVLSTGTLVGFEALLRWLHPSRGMIAPNEFIPHAEETGLIVDIGQWTLIEAMRQLNAWTQQGLVMADINMAVNLSTRQFQDRDLLRSTRQVLEQEHVSASSLVLEVTESALIGNMDIAKRTLEELRLLGIRLDLDDFGTGYSSLHYLHRLPFNSLKIDQSFVRSIEESAESRAIARSIIQLGTSLNLAVIAEGVETEEQRERLISLGCFYGQGYLFSRPLAAPAMEQLLRERQLHSPLSP